MKMIIEIGAILLMIWPIYKICTAIFKVGFALFSGVFNIYGKILVVILVITGFILGFPWSIIPTIILFLILQAARW